jgi:hypothetical protein
MVSRTWEPYRFNHGIVILETAMLAAFFKEYLSIEAPPHDP